MQRIKEFLIFLIILVLVSSFLVSSFGVQKTNIKLSKTSSDVLEEIDSKEKIEVVIKFNDSNKKNNASYVSKEVTYSDLENLEKDSSIEKIFPKFHITSQLQEATGIILSNSTNILKINNINLTGINQTICIIDSGVNFLHPDLIGKNESCVVDCFNKACVENCSISDDNGHGTHIAGIISASGNLTGVAPNSSLIAVKILDSSGDGSGNSNDLNNAVDYCVSQNVSVISMSLGTVSLFENYCDEVSGLGNWRDSINSATRNNISVVVASGNDANTTHISAPACITNSTAVADTYDANRGSITWGSTCTDLTTNIDKIVCHANRNSLLKILAPGAIINSTYNDLSYSEKGGTSMATPFVSASIAILKQFLESSNQQKNTTQIEDLLFETGKKISENNNTFSRINIYNATLSLDNISPEVNLISPEDNSLNLTQNHSFLCNTTDWQLANLTLQIWNSTSLYYEETKNISGTTNSSSFNLTNIPLGSYNWNCLSTDSKSNSAFSISNFSIFIGGISSTLISPSNNTFTNQNETSFSCNSSTDSTSTLSNSTLYIWNSSNYLIYDETKNISGTTNNSVFNYNLTLEDTFYWNCFSINNKTNSTFATNNFSLTFDLTKPNISNISSSISSNSAVINWTTSEESNSSINNSGSLTSSSSFQTNHSLTLSSLSAGSYEINITSCDRAGNCNSTNSSFTISEEISESSSPGGGGSSGGGTSSPSKPVNSTQNSSNNQTNNTFPIKAFQDIITSEEIKIGTSINLNLNDSLLIELNKSNHTILLNKIEENKANITIRSEPQNILLEVGEEEKLNLTSQNYFDLFLKLNSLNNNSINLTIKQIYEEIDHKEKDQKISKILLSILIALIFLYALYKAYLPLKKKKLKTKETLEKNEENKKSKKTKT